MTRLRQCPRPDLLAIYARRPAAPRCRSAGRGDPGAALLVEIAIDPLRTRRRVMVGAGIAVVRGGAATVGFLISHHGAAQAAAMPKCTGIATRLVGVWDAATKVSSPTTLAARNPCRC